MIYLIFILCLFYFYILSFFPVVTTGVVFRHDIYTAIQKLNATFHKNQNDISSYDRCSSDFRSYLSKGSDQSAILYEKKYQLLKKFGGKI